MQEILVGVDPATRTTGVSAMLWPECEIFTLMTICAKSNRDPLVRIDDIDERFGKFLCWLTTINGVLIRAIAIEQPSDHFGQNRHTTSFLLGRVTDRLAQTAKQFAADMVFEFTPSESSAALGLPRNAAKADRVVAAKQYFNSIVAASYDGWDAAAVCVPLIGKLKEEQYANI